MLAIFVILAFTIYLAFFFPMEPRKKEVEEKSPKYTAQMKKLWQVAQSSMRERKPFRAEQALLTILKFDEKNAAAYNRLGILYAKSQRYKEAVECFEIAQSLDNNPASIHNVGLIYLEIGAYEKAAMAFKQAIELEGDVPTRYIALAKAEEKLGNTKKAIEALENAYELDPKVSVLRQILAIYENSDNAEAAAATSARIEEQIMKDNEAKKRRAAARNRGAVAKTARRITNKNRRTSMGVKPIARSKSASTTADTAKTKKVASKPKSAPRIIKSHAGRKRI